MAGPVVNVNLIYPPFSTILDLAPFMAADESIDITDAIEAPHETNQFVASDLSLKLQDDSARSVKGILKSIPVDTMDYMIQVWRDGRKIFDGFVLPNTVQFDDREYSVAFTAVGQAKRLSLKDASGLFLRDDSGWTVAADSEKDSKYVTIANAALPQTCVFAAGDKIRCSGIIPPVYPAKDPTSFSSDLDVTDVIPLGDPPFTQWQITVGEALRDGIKTGFAVSLLTKYARNVPMRDAVTALFEAAALEAPAGERYAVVPIVAPDNQPIASNPVLTGMEGNPLGVAPIDTGFIGTTLRRVVVGATAGLYEQDTPPTGAWTLLNVANKYRPDDPTRLWPNGTTHLTGFLMCGPRVSHSNALNYQFFVYAYGNALNAGSPASPTRFRLSVHAGAENKAPYSWSWELESQTTLSGFTWSAPTLLASGSGTSQGKELRDYLADERCIGIDYDDVRGCVYFTEPFDELADGTRVGFRISYWRLSDATYHATLEWLRGIPQLRPNEGFPASFLNVYCLDSFLGNAPAMYGYECNADGSLTASGADPVPLAPDFRPHTLRKNAGDGYYYGLSSSTEGGVWLYQFGNSGLTYQPAPPVMLAAPGVPAGEVNLTVVWDTSRAAGKPFPMYAVFGNRLWWVDTTWTGIIAYMDLDGLTCADALAQLATLNDGFFYVDGTGASWFRSRTTLAPETIANPAGVNSDVLDDDLLLALRTQPIWAKTYRFITVKNEKDDAIVGTAGDINYSGENNPLHLQLSTRFAPTLSFCQALAKVIFEYLGRGLRIVEAEHYEDGRRYVLGYTFRATVDDVVRTFQIVEAHPSVLGWTVKVVGAEA